MDPMNPTPEGPRLTALGKVVIFLFIAVCVFGAYYLFTGKKSLKEAIPVSTNFTGGGASVEIGIAYGRE
jgi:hypothetical protein